MNERLNEISTPIFLPITKPAEGRDKTQLGGQELSLQAAAGSLAPLPSCPVLTEAKLWEEPECLLGSMEEMPLRVSLLLLLGLWTLRLE